MNESHRSNWKRLLIGGLISALIAGVSTGLVLYNYDMSGSVIFFMLLGFLWPAFIVRQWSRIVIVMLAIVIWFLIGIAINHFSRKAIKTIILWVVVYAVSYAIALALFADMMN